MFIQVETSGNIFTHAHQIYLKVSVLNVFNAEFTFLLGYTSQYVELDSEFEQEYTKLTEQQYKDIKHSHSRNSPRHFAIKLFCIILYFLFVFENYTSMNFSTCHLNSITIFEINLEFKMHL